MEKSVGRELRGIRLRTMKKLKNLLGFSSMASQSPVLIRNPPVAITHE
jgi:hypothetical protein